MREKARKINTVYRPASFDTAYTEYFSKPDFAKLRKVLNARQFRLGDKDISYRVLSHWDEKGILPKGVEQEEGWRRFTLVEMVWLEVVKRLREFGVSLERIAEAREQIMDWEPKKSGYPLFEVHVAFAWATDRDPYVAVLPNGTAYVASLDEVGITQSLFYEGGDVLLISLKSILRSKGHKVPASRTSVPLSAKDLAVIDALHRNNKTVNVSLRNDEVSEIETVEGYPEKPVLTELREALSKDGVFGEMITRYSNGDLQSADIVRRERFK